MRGGRPRVTDEGVAREYNPHELALTPGTRLGPYEIVILLGTGGMGEVYRARDSRLDRDVAIKVLPAPVADDPDRLRRFEHEARAIASLNHPHICQLYDIGPGYLVLEDIDGAPLRGPVPEAEAVRQAIQIARALEAAHDRGILHRDLKPTNVLVTRDGGQAPRFRPGQLLRPTQETRTSHAPAAIPSLALFWVRQATCRRNKRRASHSTSVPTSSASASSCMSWCPAFDRPAITTRSVRPGTPTALGRIVKRCLAAIHATAFRRWPR